jgi:sodium-dependent dicarboxylate transporter 2/3/5
VLKTKLIPLLLGPITFALVLMFLKPDGLSEEGVAVLACTCWIAIWWIFEATNISVTALLPIILFPLSGALDIETTTASYGHKYVFLYLGGFILAISIEKWNLHKRIALHIIQFVGTDVSKIILGFMIATAFMSMWISNTATSVMMLPIGMAIIAQLRDHPGTEINENLIFGKALMLSIAYSASIGGVATLIGTPPNLVLAGVVQEIYGIEISFAQWMMFGLPLSLVLLGICWVYLTKFAFTFKKEKFKAGESEIKDLLKKLGIMSYEEKIVSLVFFMTAFLWISRSLILTDVFPHLDDTIIAMLSAVSLFLLPKKGGKGRLITWDEAVKLPWGIIILFGGGLALASGFQSSGLAVWIGEQLVSLAGVKLVLILLILIAAVNFLTEITSNLATTAMLLPVLAPMAVSLDVHPFILMVAATAAASCAFMLPVATPPNAVVFGSGYLRIPDMVRAGVGLNIISIFLILLAVYFLLPLIWGFNSNVFPLDFQ